MSKNAKRRGGSPTLGAQIIGGLHEAVAYEAGELDATTRRVSLSAREARVEPAPFFSRERIIELRGQLKLSQPLFAQALNVSPETVRAWEQGKREPDGAALRLLQLAEEHPSWVTASIQPRPSWSARSDREA